MKYIDIWFHQLGTPLRIKLFLFTSIGLCIGAKAVWRVDSIDLPPHYLFFVIPGVVVSILLKQIEKTEITRRNNLLAQRLNLWAISLILLWVVMSFLWLPGVLAYWLEFSNEALELMTATLLLSRVSFTWRKIEQFLRCENRRHSLHLSSQA